MRPGILLTMFATWIVLSVTTQPLSAARPAPPTGAVTTAPERLTRIKVEGAPQPTLQEAWQSAEAKALDELVKHFREQGLPVTRVPTMADLRPMLARHWKYKEDQKVFAEPVGQLMYWVSLDIPVVPEVQSFLIQKERDRRVQERMVWLGKILAGLVVVFAAGGLYFRLDDWTKGYYTTWLRLATVGFVGTCALLLLLIA
jgi:hypothetical protein